jgi:hypothetical protein
MSIIFPSSPSANQVFSSNNSTWIWDGVSWSSYNNPNPGVYTNVDEFTANGTGTTFVLSSSPTASNNAIVNINGVTQQRYTYTLSGNTIIFSTAPFSGANVEVFYSYNATYSNTFLVSTSTTPGIYGSSTSIPTITVNQFGQVTSATNNPISALSPVGTPGVYGNTTNIPTITVNQYGQVTSVSNNTISTGGGPIIFNSNVISSNVTFASGTNGFSVGPMSINNGITVTVNAGQRWIIF